MPTRNLTRYLLPLPLLCCLAGTVLTAQGHAAGEAPAVAPRPSAPAKKVRKPKPAAGGVIKPKVETPAPVAPVSTTRYEEIELVPVPPPTPTPANEVAD